VPLATTTAVILLGVAWVDTVIYRQYRFHLNAEVFDLLFGGAAGDILQFSGGMLAKAGLLLLALIVIEIVAGRWVWRRSSVAPSPRLRVLVMIVAFSLVAVEHGMYAWADAAGYVPITRLGRLLPASRPLTAEILFRRVGISVAERNRASAGIGPGALLRYPRSAVECRPVAEPRDIVFIVVDSWRFDALDARITPNISRFADRCQRFDDHFSGGSATRTGIFSLFYGLPGTYWHDMLGERRGPVLVHELLRQGYEFGVFASASLVSPEFHRTVFSEIDPLRLRTEGSRAEERDRNLASDFEAFLRTRSSTRPLFAFLFFDAPHAYDLPKDYPRPFEPSWTEVDYLELGPDFDPEPFRNLYFNSLHFVDSLVGGVLDALDRSKLLDDAVVLITGDHGQEFNESGLGYWGHNSNFTRWQTGVPLLVQWPGRAPRAWSHRTSHFDVAPTLMSDFLGCGRDFDDYSVGRHLLEAGGRDVLLLSNYTDSAIVRPNEIIVSYPYGVEVLDLDYRPVPDAPIDRDALLESMRQRSRFYGP
jgi:membrane-anchored protein YejM (alkaline phosphatase superfamily)